MNLVPQYILDNGNLPRRRLCFYRLAADAKLEINATLQIDLWTATTIAASSLTTRIHLPIPSFSSVLKMVVHHVFIRVSALLYFVRFLGANAFVVRIHGAFIRRRLAVRSR